MTREQAMELAGRHEGATLINALAGREVDGVRLATAEVVIGADVLGQVGDRVRARWGRQARVTLLMDARTAAAAGDAVARQFDRPQVLCLEPLPGWGKLTAHESLALTAAEAAAGEVLIGVGSGTVSDLTKYAAARLGRPCVAVPTAASMNGYTSGIAALLVNGLKSTLPCTPPVAVLADTRVLAAAPPEMARSGYADLLSKPVCGADWRLAALLFGEAWSPLPGRLVNAAVDRCLERAAAIGAGDPEAVGELFASLILSGFSMVLAGSSAPASGGEHLISHYWDMTAYGAGRQPALHGLQVGLGTVLSARLYELVRLSDPADFHAPVRRPADLEAFHGGLWPAIAAEAEAQLLDAGAAAARLNLIRQQWSSLWTELDPVLTSAAEAAARLRRAGISLDLAACDLDPVLAQRAILGAADIRNRYTILHLARDIGLLTPATAAVTLAALTP